jgi:hypothetical protein
MDSFSGQQAPSQFIAKWPRISDYEKSDLGMSSNVRLQELEAIHLKFGRLQTVETLRGCLLDFMVFVSQLVITFVRIALLLVSSNDNQHATLIQGASFVGQVDYQRLHPQVCLLA